MVDPKKLLKRIAEVNEIRTHELCKEFGVNEKEVKEACKELEEKGLISRYTRYIEGDGFTVEATKKGRTLVHKKPSS
tara:strand:+ start:383 stop:613 length:231 start_codon:yes stop_codon:yes gene_type:complete